MSFFPLDRDILTSSLWAEGSPADLKVWLYLLLNADPRTGIVPDADPAIAVRCGLELDQVVSALTYLEQPDRYSRSETKEGRRIERVNGRIRIVNYRKHMNKDYSTPRVKKWRERQSETVKRVSKRPPVTKTTDTDTDTDTKKVPSSPATSELLSKVEASPPSELAPNPFHFVAYWKDANETRDFQISFEPVAGFETFMKDETRKLGMSLSHDELARFAQRSIVKFTATYSKRDIRGKTRGARIGPNRLTEELVAWIRSDLASAGQRQASSQSSKSRAQRIDDQTRKLMGK